MPWRAVSKPYYALQPRVRCRRASSCRPPEGADSERVLKGLLVLLGRRHRQAVNGLAMVGPSGAEGGGPEGSEMWTCGDDGLLVRWRRRAAEVRMLRSIA